MRYWILLFSVSILLLGSCNNTIPVGPEILPEGDGQENLYNDTTTIFSTTVREDSLRSDKLFLSQLGHMVDPIFGTTKSSLLVGFRVPNGAVSPSIFDTVGGYKLDSTILALTVVGTYGDTTDMMGFTVYKLPTPLDNDEVYFSNIDFAQGMVEVGRIVDYAPRLSSQYDEDTTFTDLGTQLRIKLNPFFGQSLLNIIGTDQLESNELLSQFLAGLIIIPDNDPGCMLEIDMAVSTTTTDKRTSLSDSRLHIYYKNAEDDNLTMILPATVLGLGVSKYEHDYNGTNVESALNLNNPAGDEVNYVQGLAGVKTKLELPYLSVYENAAVRKAEFVITQIKDGFESTFLPPQRVLIVAIDEDGDNENTSDFRFFETSHVDGFGEEKILSDGEEVLEYRINVSDHLQKIFLNQEDNNGFYVTLYPAQDVSVTNLNGSDLIPDRLVIGGGNNTSDEYRVKLEIAYTLLE